MAKTKVETPKEQDPVTDNPVDSPLSYEEILAENNANKARIAELEALLNSKDPVVEVPKLEQQKVKVNHGVFIPSLKKHYTVDQIKSSAEVQAYLLEIKSSAVSRIK